MELDRNGLATLDRQESLDLLRSAVVGRVLITEGALPVAFPVNYALFGDDIVFRSDAGTKLKAASTNAVIGFQVDDFDVEGRGGWSVLVTGHASEIEDPVELEAARGLPLDCWVPEPRHHFVRIHSQLVTGRRLRGAPLPSELPERTSRLSSRAPWSGPAVDACRSCGWARLLPVNDGELTNFLCPNCGVCWHVEQGWMSRVDPTTCPGCRHRNVCTRAFLADALTIENASAP
jgi:nitroimidazol reductase NimA-like FMN-containing flavoprotein (pyridoxamine 5'-phosphate oxidase superfamily)